MLNRRTDGILALMSDTANVILQLAWPQIGYGVVESRVASGQVMRRPAKRARTTLGYLGIALYGSQEQIDTYRAAVNTAHRQVHSTAESPVRYNAFSRELQLWVASCLFYGFWDGSTRMHGPMTADEEEVLLRAAAPLGTSLQVPRDAWHASMADFWDYWEAGLRRADIDQTVGAYFQDLLALRMVPTPLRQILSPMHTWLNTGFLPEPIRRQLDLAWSEADQRRHDRLLRGIGALNRRLPTALRRFPLNLMAQLTWARHRLGLPMV